MQQVDAGKLGVSDDWDFIVLSLSCRDQFLKALRLMWFIPCHEDLSFTFEINSYDKRVYIQHVHEHIAMHT